MKKHWKKFISIFNAEVDKNYLSKNDELILHKEIIDGVINAKNGGDLKILLDKMNKTVFRDRTRYMFLIGLLQGSLMQFKKDICIEQLKNKFRDF